jgi:hypothetical protein
MHQELTETFDQVSQIQSSRLSSRSSSKHGSQSRPAGAFDGLPDYRSRSASPGPVFAADGAVNADRLDSRLRRLSSSSSAVADHPRPPVAGQRVSDYEKALISGYPSPRQSLAFKVVRRHDSPSDGVQLTDFPNG